jgi:ParB family transcriptional regulator, chromosome partitioning protein
MSTRAISGIRVGERIRKDVGDVAALAESIRLLGLINPIIVRPDGTLISGERRLRACTLLGWTEIPVRILAEPSICK